MLLRVFQNDLMEHRLIVRDGFRREAMHLDGKARIRIHEGVVLLYPCIAQRQRFLVPVKAELYAVLLQPGRIRKRQGIVPGNQNFHILDDRAIIRIGVPQQIVEGQVLVVGNQEVDAVAAVHKEVGGVVLDDVVPGAAEQYILSLSTVEVIISAAAEKDVVSRAAVQVVIAAQTEEDIVPFATEQPIVTVGRVFQMLFRPVRKLMQLGAIVAQIQDGIAQGCRSDPV